MDKTYRYLLCFVAFCLWGSASSADDVQVNTYTTGLQGQASVALNDDGDFVVVWTSAGSPGDDPSFSIQGQRYAPDGSPAGGQFQVNTFTLYSDFVPSVAIGSDGEFVVVWTSGDFQIRGRRFAADGSGLGDDFQVNSYNGGYQNAASVAMASTGDFVVAWQSRESAGTDTSFNSIQARRYAADGSDLGPQFQVNTFTTRAQLDPGLAMNSDGDFVVVWENFGAPGDFAKIDGQRFAADGTPVGEEFRVHRSAGGNVGQANPVVASDAEGDFVVVWDVYNGILDEIWARRYTSDGSPAAPPFRVISENPNFYNPSVALSADGDFVIVWDRGEQVESVIEGQRYASDGSKIGGLFQVNTNPLGTHFSPSVSANGWGEFLVAWSGEEVGGNDPDRSIQRSDLFFLSDLIFADGFESGDTSAWSDAQP